MKRGNNILRFVCIIVGILGAAASGYMLTTEKALRKVVEPAVDSNVQVIGQTITDLEGKKEDNAMAYASKY